MPEQRPTPQNPPQSDASQPEPSAKDKQQRMEEAQKQAAEERRDEGGYQ